MLVLSEGARDDSAARVLVASCMIDSVAKTLSEIGPLQVIDERPPGPSDAQVETADRRSARTDNALELKSDIVSDDTISTIRLQLMHKHDGRAVWTDSLQVRQSDELSLDSPALVGRLNNVVYAAIEELVKLDRDTANEHPLASTLCYNGIQYFFRLGSANWQVADELFERAYEIDPSYPAASMRRSRLFTTLPNF